MKHTFSLFSLFLVAMCIFMCEYDVSMCFGYMMVHEPVWVHACMQISLFVEITEGYQDLVLSLSTYSFETFLLLQKLFFISILPMHMCVDLH